MESLHKWMKGQETEPKMYTTICWYIRGKGWKIFQDEPHLPMEISYSDKVQDNIGWDNMIRGWIAIH